MDFLFAENAHRRFNPLSGQWVLVSPHRTQRPWQGKTETEPVRAKPEYDPACYLCPGNRRANGATNPQYENTFVFENDFAALREDAHAAEASTHPLITFQKASGICRVICFSPRHDLTLPVMPTEAIAAVIDGWADQTAALKKTYRWVQIFENKGDIMDAQTRTRTAKSGRVPFFPNEALVEDYRQKQYVTEHGANMLVDYAEYENRAEERIVVRNACWTAIVPFWAVWPFETLLVPNRPVARLDDLTGAQRESLADILKRLLTKYDNLFSTSFPYSFGWHGAPCDGADYSHWQLHAHFYPPLLRSRTIKKFMVGYELLAEAQRDITAEQAAQRLRDLPEIHYTEISEQR